MRFLDTNIFLSHYTKDDPAQFAASEAVLLRIEQRLEIVYTTHLVIFEVIFTLERRYKWPKEEVAALVLPFLSFRNLRIPNKKLLREAFQLHLAYPIGFADAYNAAYMLSRGESEIYSFDKKDFDKVPGVRRVEP